MENAINWAMANRNIVLTLLGVTYTLFGGMLTTAFVLWRRNRTASEHPDAKEIAASRPEFSDPELSRG